MGSKECDIRRNLGVPEDSKPILNKEGLIVGITTGDGSFDYSDNGQEFLRLNIKDIPPKSLLCNCSLGVSS